MDDNCSSACRASIMALRNASGDPNHAEAISTGWAGGPLTFTAATPRVDSCPTEQTDTHRSEKGSSTQPGGAICRTPTDERELM